MKSRNTTGTRRWPSSPSPTFWQSHPGSSLQSALQPSPEVALPSSHSSPSSLRPSPHGEAQPEVPMQTGSARQSALQPSPPNTSPSSHDSSPSRTSSPQTVGWQATPGVGQAEPGSTRHASLQPSPGMSLPSSQVSPPITMPSPQIGMQRAPIAGQIQPGSILQSSAQPSPDVRLRSSHISDPPTRPSPQETVQVQGSPGAVQIQSVSVLQSGEQPSPPLVFPSSQVSAGRFNFPFPQGGTGQLRPVAGSQAGHRSKDGTSAGITSRRTSAALSGVDASRGAVPLTLATHAPTAADITAAATAVPMAPARVRPGSVEQREWTTRERIRDQDSLGSALRSRTVGSWKTDHVVYGSL